MSDTAPACPHVVTDGVSSHCGLAERQMASLAAQLADAHAATDRAVEAHRAEVERLYVTLRRADLDREKQRIKVAELRQELSDLRAERALVTDPEQAE